MDMSVYSTGAFWAGTAERAVKTTAQALLASFAIGATSLADIDWQGVLSIGVLAGITSILTSLATATTVAPPPPPPDQAQIEAAVDKALADENARQGRINKEKLAAIQAEGKHEAQEGE